jgi:hypothetical protein
MALCYYSDDVKLHGWHHVLRPLIQELKILESDGMWLTVDGNEINVRVLISCLTGDNLFLNSVLGFTESFVANYPCRHCTLPRAAFQTVFAEDDSTVRTRESYDTDVEKHIVNETGIKFASPLNQLTNFHACENFIQDVMHDMLEGVCKYDMKLIICHVMKLDACH